MKNLYLTATQIEIELEKCLQCPSRPCMNACPAAVSPKDFIAAAKIGDWQGAAKLINDKNHLGEVCGLICPDNFCLRACVRAKIDVPVKIPALQAAIMGKARQENLSLAQNMPANGYKVAVIGAGPAGCGAVAELLKNGYKVDVFERENSVGGALNLIPEARLPREIIAYEWQRLRQNPLVKLHLQTPIDDYEELLKQGYFGVIVTTGAPNLRTLNIEGENLALSYIKYLQKPQNYATAGQVVIVGGGAVAVDCAITAKKQGAKQVKMLVRRRIEDMRINAAERQSLFAEDIDICPTTRLTKIEREGDKLTIYTIHTAYNADGHWQDVAGTQNALQDFDYVVLALGSSGMAEIPHQPQIFYAGDVTTGATTAVQALAAGKQAAFELIKQAKD